MIALVAKQADWQALLVDGYEPLKRVQKVFSKLPSDPRCTMCKSAFGGVGGRIFGWTGRKPSRKNPNLCQYCFDHLPDGGLELDIGVVFADVRGSTAMGEQSSATDFAERLNHFYAAAAEVLIDHDGIIDKLIGDEVMALFLPGLGGPDYRRRAALAAIDLAGATHGLPVGVAANAGTAFVGNVGSGTIKDFTALGDAVNTASRLQSFASPGEVVLATELYDLVAGDHPSARAERVEVRGRAAPVDVRILTP
jgi:adenylate cyclase